MAVAQNTLDREVVSTSKIESQLSVTWRRFRRHKLAFLGLFILSFLILAALTARLWTPYDPYAAPPPAVRPFSSPMYKAANNDIFIAGTDDIGRDFLSRLAYGGQISLSIGILVTILVGLIGTAVGAISGYFGGIVDSILMRIVDVLLSLPFLPLILAVSALLGQGYWTIVLVLTALGWTTTSRLVRGTIISLRNLEYVEATKALGASNTRIITRHLLPNSLAPIIVDATLNVGGFILIESAVSFLGLGIVPPIPSWGNMLSDAEGYFTNAPLQIIWPGLLIFLTVLSINFIGDALRDALDPRLK